MARGVVTNIQGLAAMCPQGNGFPPAISNGLATLTAHRLRYLVQLLTPGAWTWHSETIMRKWQFRTRNDLAVRFRLIEWCKCAHSQMWHVLRELDGLGPLIHLTM